MKLDDFKLRASWRVGTHTIELKLPAAKSAGPHQDLLKALRQLTKLAQALGLENEARDTVVRALTDVEAIDEALASAVQVRLRGRQPWIIPAPTKTEHTPLLRAKYLVRNWPERYEMRLLYDPVGLAALKTSNPSEGVPS